MAPPASVRREPAEAGGPSQWTQLDLPTGFDFLWTVRFLSARVAAAMEVIDATSYSRTTRIDGGAVLVEIRYQEGAAGRRPHLAVRSLPAHPTGRIQALVDRMFDLSADLPAFLALAEGDPVLGELVRARPWIRLPQIPDPFEGLLRAILGQQVSVAAATTMVDRLVRLLGDPIAEIGPQRLCAFPAPGAIFDAGEPALRGIGLTRAKTHTILEAARAALDGRLGWEELRTAPAEAAHGTLTALPGIGPWTASYLRMRALADRDAFPASDLGVLKAIQRARGDARRPTPVEAAHLAEPWRPWRAYAALHLWESLAHPTGTGT